ncbi:hypothetical protein SKAU_G00324750 [Synaphobranchus kaupii]|uniref:Uncharacterized protein n=1 Tax=Synaphobranchus kaupii TaxID=118154 RepID=A0A9Q1EPI2_SYNKA|nr:hypothetical protein SKAU_G00324750 [Synaphobranchus kaupii]
MTPQGIAALVCRPPPGVWGVDEDDKGRWRGPWKAGKCQPRARASDPTAARRGQRHEGRSPVTMFFRG